MYLGLHLCGPKGDGSRILLDRALALLQFDNECVVQAMLRSGRAVPDCMEELGLEYEASRPPYNPWLQSRGGEDHKSRYTVPNSRGRGR